MTLEALMLLPTVEPDYRGHRRPAAATLAAATVWLLLHDPATWTRVPGLYRWCVAKELLARREMADAGELVS